MSADRFNWNCNWSVRKWDEDAVEYLTRKLGRAPKGADFAAARIDPYEDNFIAGNLLTTAGLGRITSLITGSGGTAFNTANSRIGVGDGTTAVAIGDTDLSALSGATHRFFQLVDSAPGHTDGVMTFVATFGSSDGNFHWQEFGIDNGTASGTTVTAPLLNHKLSDQGTKTSGQSWTATATVTLS